MQHEDYANEGLPEADDYDPDALGTVETRAGEPEQEWPEFGLELVPVEYRSKTQGEWQDTGRRLVQRNGKFVSDVSRDYKLLPNEQLIGVANNVADDLGAIPFHEYDGDWFVELDDHVFQNPERTRVHGVYAWKNADVGGDDMSYGFAVHNSIDGSLGFSVGLFTFRHACANMVFLGTKGVNEQRALSVESEREIKNRTQHAHTSGLAVGEEELGAVIKSTLTLVDDVHHTYQEWVAERITAEDVRDLLRRAESGSLAFADLPDWVTKANGAIEEVHAEEYEDEDEQMPWERQAEIIEAEMPQAETVWSTYNDLTNNIWHSGSSGDTTRRSKMRDVHRVFDPSEHGDSGQKLY
jgi:hypothetical protein